MRHRTLAEDVQAAAKQRRALVLVVRRPRATLDIWLTETALTTALNTSYMASRLAIFGIVTGIAFLLTGIGFGILAIAGALRSPETALTWFAKRRAASKVATV